MKKNFRSNRGVVLTVVIIALLIMFVGPLILEFAIFRNSFESVLSNAEWGSFLGSFIGGVVGGAGTLIAVYVSLNHTMRLQDKLEERIREDKLNDELYRRKLFCDVIAEDVATFIECASKSFYSHSIRNTLLTRKHIIVDKLDSCDTRILELIQERKKFSKMVSIWRLFAHSTETSLIRDELDQLRVEKSLLERELTDIKEQIDKYTTGDSKLINSFYLLEIKLNDMVEASSLIGLLNEARSECYRAEELEEYWIEGQNDRIIAETKRFVIQYSDMSLN